MSLNSLPQCYGGTLQLARISGSQWYELLMMCDKEYEGELFLKVFILIFALTFLL